MAQEKVGPKTLSLFLLSMMTLGLIVGIPVAADLAKDGPIAITIILFGFLAAFIPTWLVCSELATMYPHDGGVYLWVKQAFGPRAGFQAIWMQWTNQIVFLTVSLSVAGASLTFLFDAEDTLADNRIYLGVVIILVIWLATGANMFGVRESGRIAAAGVLLATIVPALVVIFVGIDFLLSGGTLHLDAEGGAAFVPTGADVSLMLPGYTAFLALEVTGVFVRRLRNPGTQYPRALLIAGLSSLGLLIGVALVIMSAQPTDQISSEAGIMSTIQALADQTRLGFLIPLTALSITIGWIGLASNIFIGPATGLLATARYGHLPKALTRENSRGAPVNMLVAQAFIATAIALVFLTFSSAQIAFTFVVTLATIIYAITYILMYAAVIRLRHTKPDLKRPFYALGKNRLWITLLSVWAIVMALAIVVNGFFAGSSLPESDAAKFPIAIGIGFVILSVLPMIVYRGSRPTDGEDLPHVVEDIEDGEVFLDETSVLPAIRPDKKQK